MGKHIGWLIGCDYLRHEPRVVANDYNNGLKPLSTNTNNGLKTYCYNMSRACGPGLETLRYKMARLYEALSVKKQLVVP